MTASSKEIHIYSGKRFCKWIQMCKKNQHNSLVYYSDPRSDHRPFRHSLRRRILLLPDKSAARLPHQGTKNETDDDRGRQGQVQSQFVQEWKGLPEFAWVRTFKITIFWGRINTKGLGASNIQLSSSREFLERRVKPWGPFTFLLRNTKGLIRA